MPDAGTYSVRLSELEQTARVPLDEQVQEQPTDRPGEYVAPEDLDRSRLLSPTSAGRLRIR